MFGGTLMVPSGFITSPGWDGMPGVSVTFTPITAGSLPTVSLSITEGVVPPTLPAMGVPLKSSSSASMIGMVSVVVSLLGFESLVAPVVPVNTTSVSLVSPPPGVPGAV